MRAADLAPGDRESASFDWAPFELKRVDSPDDPLFERAYEILWREFGAKGELETRDVLRARFRSRALLYEMRVVLREGRVVAVRDHSAVLGSEAAVVHLSHAWIDPAHRGQGMVGWLRSWPVETARRLAGNTLPVVLAAEMEPATAPDALPRRRSYGRAGFLMMDLPYLQPDFRAPAEIDADGGPKPLALDLIVRRVGRESERQISGREARDIVTSLYRIYGDSFRPQDMKPLFARPQPADDAIVKLKELA